MSTIEVRDEGHVRWIGLDRPDKRNAIDQAMAEDFATALEDARRQPCVLIVHSTTPGIFAAGADIAELRDRDLAATIARRSWRALELTKLALRSQRQATTTFDLAAQALLFGTEDKYERMTAFLERKPR